MAYELERELLAELPVKSVRAIIEIVRDGSHDLYHRTLASAILNVVSYGAGILVRDETVMAAIPCDEDECRLISELASTLAVSTNVATVCDSPITATSACDAMLWLEIVRILWDVLKTLRG